jgi:hypothetical protein
MFPDVALLRIFDFYLDKAWIDTWYTLVHVCRKWRNVVFGSPRRLNLRLRCRASTPARETLDVWPLLPIIVRGDGHRNWGMDSIVAALEHNDRVCAIDLLYLPSSMLEKVLEAMEQPYPELTRLDLQTEGDAAPVAPASFLGGSASGLQQLRLCHIILPGLSNLLLSATHLVHLHLWNIPHRGYISPEAMVTCLSVLTRLESLDLTFESPQSRPNRESRPPPQTRTLLLVLTKWEFKGVCEYSEDLLARIDAPLLGNLHITVFHQLEFDVRQLTQFISRLPKFKVHNDGDCVFSNRDVSVTLPKTSGGRFHFAILARWLSL